ncbi:pilus assembly PilX family protein [Ectothiorhodospira haloalkaliphila]|uniref:pilus assembly PilX family protein n=1 Tax=Ectothiorhodospira haloalkaliphila TaxID=421628 RepID=UPI0009FD7170|nr:pilus assembly PilX N-terminal domain-containing protein [Ectothiorhodospira haloalkaliphila]
MRYRPAKEQGAVLIVSLVMLSLATLIGVSGMTSAHLQERIAGNQKQGTDAFMAAETGVAEVLANSRLSYKNLNRLDPDVLLEDLGGMGPHDVTGEHPAQWWLAQAPEASGSAMTVQVVGGVGNTAARRTLEITLETGLGGPHPEGAYHCFGAACAVDDDDVVVQSDNFDLLFDGRIWPLPSSDDGYVCTSGSCPSDPPENLPEALAEALPVTGLYLVLGDANATAEGPRSVETTSERIHGEPAPVMVSEGVSTGGGNPSGTRASDWKSYVDQLLTHPERKHVQLDADGGPLINDRSPTEYGGSVGSVYVQDFMGNRESPRIHHVEGGGRIGLSGDMHGAGILVISDDVRLDPGTGNSITFEGLVILLEGAHLNADEASVNIFGSVVSLAGDDGNLFDDLSGNINIRYSPEALDNLREHGLWDAAFEHPQITAWRELM